MMQTPVVLICLQALPLGFCQLIHRRVSWRKQGDQRCWIVERGSDISSREDKLGEVRELRVRHQLAENCWHRSTVGSAVPEKEKEKEYTR
jgi:hypothetical protein